MKKKDIFSIVVVIFISGVISVIISSIFISSPKNRTTKVEVVEKITSDFPLPKDKYFNKDSRNPTQLINIGNNANTNPFNGPKQ